MLNKIYNMNCVFTVSVTRTRGLRCLPYLSIGILQSIELFIVVIEVCHMTSFITHLTNLTKGHKY